MVPACVRTFQKEPLLQLHRCLVSAGGGAGGSPGVFITQSEGEVEIWGGEQGPWGPLGLPDGTLPALLPTA